MKNSHYQHFWRWKTLSFLNPESGKKDGIYLIFLYFHRYSKTWENVVFGTVWAMSKSLDIFSTIYNQIALLGGFIVGTDENCMKDFYDSYSLHNLINYVTCYKNPENLKFVDLTLWISLHVSFWHSVYLIKLSIMGKPLKNCGHIL